MATTSKSIAKKTPVNSKTKTTSSVSDNLKSTGKSENKKTLESLFENGLKDVYSAETQLLEALPKMAKAAESEKLQDAFTKHEQETKRHVERLDKIFSRLNIDKSDIEKCAAMEGLIEEGNKIIKEYEESAVRDSALIIGAQKVEHYEIASYGSLCELADVLGYTKIVDILDATLAEEEKTDRTLTSISQTVNDEAYEMSQHEELEEAE